MKLFGTMIIIWMASWYMSIWVSAYSRELFLTGAFSLFIATMLAYGEDKK